MSTAFAAAANDDGKSFTYIALHVIGSNIWCGTPLIQYDYLWVRLFLGKSPCRNFIVPQSPPKTGNYGFFFRRCARRDIMFRASTSAEKAMAA